MTTSGIGRRTRLAALAIAALSVACGKQGPKYDTNLLTNGSFEKVGSDGIPKGWKLVLFRGGLNESEASYGTDTLAVDGKKSWYFRADPGTRRFYFLSQEVETGDITHVRIRGWLQTDDTRLRAGQSAQCNFMLTFYDKDHNRFQVERFGDRRTPLRAGTSPWEEESYTFAVPNGTRYVAAMCALGMNGQAWFDNVSLEIPKPVDWQTATTKNFAFHWLPGHPMPDGSREAQQQVFDYAASRLGVKSDVVINYYVYSDTATIRRMLGIKGFQYVSWDDNEFHSIDPNENHEVIHFITDSIGRPPRSIAEGTVFWIQDEWNGRPLDETIKELVRADRVTPLPTLFEYHLFAASNPEESMPSAAAFVKFLVDRWGPAKLMELYRTINGMNSLQAVASGFEVVYGMPLKDAGDAWNIWLKSHYLKA